MTTLAHHRTKYQIGASIFVIEIKSTFDRGELVYSRKVEKFVEPYEYFGRCLSAHVINVYSPGHPESSSIYR